MNKSTGSIAVKSVSWRGAGAFIQLILGFIFTLLFMRYLTPDEYGVIAKVYIVLSLFNVFLDFGFSQAIIQSKESSKKFLSSHFYISLAIAVLLAVILVLSAGSIAKFYEVPELRKILYVLSINLIAGGMIIVHRAYMNKKLKFKELSIINFIAFSVSGIIGIILARVGYSYYAVIVQLMLLNFIQVILIWFYSGFKPSFDFDYKHILKTSNFSFYIFLSHLIIYISEMLDQFLSSIYFNHNTLGKYNRSISLTRNPVKAVPNTLNTVLFPLFSHTINEQGVDKNENIYVRTACVIFHMIAPLLLIIFMFPEEITHMLLPESWYEIHPLIKVLSIISLLMILELENPLFLSKGRSKQLTAIIFINKSIRIICIIVGIQYGLMSLLYALLIAEVIMRIVYMLVSYFLLKLDVRNYFKKMSTSLFMVALFLLFLYIIKVVNLDNGIWIISISLLIYVIYVVITYLLNIGQVGKDLRIIKEKLI